MKDHVIMVPNLRETVVVPKPERAMEIPQGGISPAQESSGRMMRDLSAGGFAEQHLANWAVSFSDKQDRYRASFERALSSLNFSYILDARGDSE